MSLLHATCLNQDRCGALKKTVRIIQKFIKWTTIIFIIIVLFSLTIAQKIPVEFANWRNMSLFYDIILQGLPIAILLTLTWTLKKRNSKNKNTFIGILTPIIAFFVYVLMILLMFSYGFGSWINQEIVYEHIENPERTINKQIWDAGAFGYGDERIIELKPFLQIWNITKPVDTTKIKQESWIRIEKRADLEFL